MGLILFAGAILVRAERRAWLTGRGYRVFDVTMTDVQADIGKVLDGLAAACAVNPSTS